jgi:hypothetical protein
VDKYGGIPPYAETQGYMSIADEYDKLREGRPTRLTEELAALRGPSQAPVKSLTEQLAEVRGEQGQPQTQGSLTEAIAQVRGEAPSGKTAYYNPYPKGSKQWAQAVQDQGGKVAIRPSAEKRGAVLAGGEFPNRGPYEQFDSTYPLQYKARISRVLDADTVEVAEAGTGRIRTIRLPDLDAAETDPARIAKKHPDWTPEQIQEQLEKGIAAKSYIAAMLEPGDQVVIETKGGEWKGAYNRDIGKVYWQGDDGSQIDLSAPHITADSQSVVKSSDPALGDSDPTWLEGIGAGLAQDVAEIAQIPWTIRDLIDWADRGDDTYDPYEDSQAYRALERWRSEMASKQAAWVASGYDPDAKVYDIPALGRLTADELAKAGLSAGAYAVGVIPVLGKAGRLLKSINYAAKMSVGLDAARVATIQSEELAKLAKRSRKYLAKALKKGDEAFKEATDMVETQRQIIERTSQIMHTAVEMDGNLTAVQAMKRFKDLFLLRWSDKYHPIVGLAKATGREKEVQFLLSQVKAAADVAKSPITDGVILYEKMADGTMVPSKVSESWTEIWSGVRGIDLNNAMSWMASDRVRGIHHFQRKIVDHFGGDGKKAANWAKENDMRWVDIDEKNVRWHQEAADEIQAYYEAVPINDKSGAIIGDQWNGVNNEGGMKHMIERTREWSVRATLDIAENIGIIDKAEKIKILNYNQKYAPFNRTNLGYLEKFLPESEVKAILTIENEMLREAGHASLMGRGLSEAGMHKGKAMPRLGHKGLHPGQPTELILDPAQTFMTRIPAFHKFANQQRVRNMMGEMLDNLGAGRTFEEGAKLSATEEWIQKTVRVVDDTTPTGRELVEAIQKSDQSNGFIRYTKDADGTKVRRAYITGDPALAQALKELDPAHMSVFKNMMQAGGASLLTKPTQMFRAGTVLGLHFMARNPMRDQFMAATLTKYGYTPVVDWWRGLWNVVTKSPIYEQTRMMGGTQSTFTAASFERAQDSITEVSTGENLMPYLRRILTGGGRPAEAAVQANRGFLAHKARSPLEALGNSFKSTLINANAGKGKRGDSVRLMGYGLRRVSEIFEEATRTGAAAKAVRRAKKGKKYTLTRSLDEALGGASGVAKMLYDPKHRKGFAARFGKARNYDAKQMAHMKRSGIYMDPDVIDEVRNITLDFQRRGTRGEMVNAFYPFFNAELQDYARFTRAVREAPITTALRGFTFVSIPAIANWYVNFDNPKYHQLPEVERELFLHPWGVSEEYKKFGRISRPIGTISGVFGLSAHKTLDWLAANDPAAIKALEEALWPGESARSARNAFIENLHETSSQLEEETPEWARGLAFAASMGNLPMHQTGELGERVHNGNPKYRNVPPMQYGLEQFGDYVSTDTALRYVHPRRKDLVGRVTSIAPQAISPFIQAQANYDPFFDRAIQSPSDLNQNMLGEDMANEFTSPFERALAGGLNTIFQMNLTPQQASHIYRRYTSSVGTMAMNGLNAALVKANIAKGAPGTAKDATEKFSTKAFYSREPYGSNSDSVRSLYDAWERDQKVLNSVDWAMKNGKIVRLMDLLHDHPEVMPAAILQEAVEDLGEFYNLRDEVRVMDGISDEERSDALFQIDQAITAYSYEMMNAYWTMSRDPSMAMDLIR